MNLYGRNSIFERLKINPKSIKRILLEEGKDLSSIRRLSKSNGIPFNCFPQARFDKFSRNIRSQGVIAEVEEFQYANLEDILDPEKVKPPIILFLDNLNDPQNLGAILRTCGCFGGFAVVLPKHDSVEVTEAALRVASGTENYVPVAKVNGLLPAVILAKERGFWIGGAMTTGGQDIASIRLNFPLGLIIGSEAKGIRQSLTKELDFGLSIPMHTGGLSFNAATAAAIFAYEAIRQKRKQS
ncbi:MAG: 23S rRNA (guanosine(2251)-2'-O)-methyltransferase RlmB [Candidatus Omnitrophota bacterium]